MHIQKKALQNNYMVERSLGNMSGTINRRKPERCCFHVVRDHALPCEIVTSLQQAQSLQCQVGGGRRDQRFFPEGDYGWCDVAHGKKARPSVTWDATVSQKQFDKLRLLWDSMGGGQAVLLQTVWNLKSVYIGIGESYTSGSYESPFFQTTVMIDFLKRRPNFPLTSHWLRCGKTTSVSEISNWQVSRWRKRLKCWWVYMHNALKCK